MTDRQAAAHLLRRLTFGPTAAEVDEAVSAPLETTLDRLLKPVPLPGPPDLGTDPFAADLTREQRMAARQNVRKQTTEATLWWLGRMTAGGATSAAEKLTFF